MALKRLWWVAGLILLAGCDGPGPHLDIPTPPHERYTGVNLRAVHAIPLTDIWIVGEMATADGPADGLLLHSEDGGHRWRRAGSEIHELADVSFTSLFFGDRIRGWIGGRRVTPEGVQRAVIFRTFDGGNHFIETILPAGDDVVIEDVHSISFKSDVDGRVSVLYRDRGSDKLKESTYETSDGGRLWVVTGFPEEPKPQVGDRTVTFVNLTASNGFRLRKSERPGVTLVEVTASAGKDWMPISEFGIGYIPTFY